MCLLSRHVGYSCCHNSNVDDFSGEAHMEELESMAKHESKEDRIFQKFKTKISLEPEQVKWNSYSSFCCSSGVGV